MRQNVRAESAECQNICQLSAGPTPLNIGRGLLLTVRKLSIYRIVVFPRRLIAMAKSHLKLVAPTTVNRTVTPRRLPNADLRTREYLTEAEVSRLQKAAGNNRWGHRDATMILVACRHGFRVSELVDLRWDQVNFNHGTLAVRRA
jgi:integrase